MCKMQTITLITFGILAGMAYGQSCSASRSYQTNSCSSLDAEMKCAYAVLLCTAGVAAMPCYDFIAITLCAEMLTNAPSSFASLQIWMVV